MASANRPLTVVKNGFWRWVRRRSPQASEVQLRHKNIYILPSRQALGIFVVIFLLWLMGTNYENNLVLAATFLLISLVVISILHAFRNLSGLRFRVLKSHPTFAGDYARFDVLVSAAAKTTHENLRIGWHKSLMVELDLIDTQEEPIQLLVNTTRRGWLTPDRLLVNSIFPLGFIRAWSWIFLDTRVLVYPRPLASERPPLGSVGGDRGDKLSRDNREEFQGFYNYYPGAPLSRVAWKHYARGAGLHLKDYVGYQSEQVWLDWQSVPGKDWETRLSHLCYWALHYDQNRTQYGLRLPSLTIEPGTGPGHRDAVLKALALYQLPQRHEAEA